MKRGRAIDNEQPGADLQDELFANYTQEDLVIIASSINVIGEQDDTGLLSPDTSRLTVAQIAVSPVGLFQRYVEERRCMC